MCWASFQRLSKLAVAVSDGSTTLVNIGLLAGSVLLGSGDNQVVRHRDGGVFVVGQELAASRRGRRIVPQRRGACGGAARAGEAERPPSGGGCRRRSPAQSGLRDAPHGCDPACGRLRPRCERARWSMTWRLGPIRRTSSDRGQRYAGWKRGRDADDLSEPGQITLITDERRHHQPGSEVTDPLAMDYSILATSPVHLPDVHQPLRPALPDPERPSDRPPFQLGDPRRRIGRHWPRRGLARQPHGRAGAAVQPDHHPAQPRRLYGG